MLRIIAALLLGGAEAFLALNKARSRPGVAPRPPPRKSVAADAAVTGGLTGEKAPTLVEELLRTAALTDRGQTATAEQRDRVRDIVADLEAQVDPVAAALDPMSQCGGLDGEWTLVYASEAPYRSSPFFWAFRAATEGLRSPVLDPSFAEAVFQITDGIPFKTIGQATQVVTGSGGPNGVLVSQVEMRISLFDALLPRARSLMTTTASTSPLPGGGGLRLAVETTAVKGSTLATLPGLRFLDAAAFPSRAAFEAAGASAEVDMRCVLFGGGAYRVAFAPGDEHFFVWSRAGVAGGQASAPEAPQAPQALEVATAEAAAEPQVPSGEMEGDLDGTPDS